MGLMIENQEIVALLARLAGREGVTKTEALRRALRNAAAELAEEDAGGPLFPRDRVTYPTAILR